MIPSDFRVHLQTRTIHRYTVHLEKTDSLGMEYEFIMLINVKMPTIVGIFTFMSMVNTISEGLKTREGFTFQHCYFYEQFKLYAQLR